MLAFKKGDEIEFQSEHGLIRFIDYQSHTVSVISNNEIKKVPFHKINKVNDNFVLISRGLKK